MASKAPLQSATTSKEDFFPKGAVAFFAGVIITFGLIWLGLYALLVQRHTGL